MINEHRLMNGVMLHLNGKKHLLKGKKVRVQKRTGFGTNDNFY